MDGRGRGAADLPTVMGIAALVGVVSTQLHEAGGHGGACLALGQHVREWGAFYLDCDVPRSAPRWIERVVAAAGSTMNLLTGLVALAMLRATRRARPETRCFWWLIGTVSGFQWAGYFLFSGVSGIGDWGAGANGVFHALPGWRVARIALAIGGALLYWLCAIVAVRTLAPLTGADEAGRRQARRLAAIAYWTIGGVALVIGLMNPVGLFILLASAVASSFGGPSGLLWAPFYMRAGAAAVPPFVIARRWSWIAAGLVAVLAEGLILGRSLHF